VAEPPSAGDRVRRGGSELVDMMCVEERERERESERERERQFRCLTQHAEPEQENDRDRHAEVLNHLAAKRQSAQEETQCHKQWDRVQNRVEACSKSAFSVSSKALL